MTSINEFHDVARRARTALEPDQATIDRIEHRYQHLDSPADALRTPRHVGARRRRALVTTIAVAAAVALALPFVLDGVDSVDGPGSSNVRVPLSASEAFARAATAAATAEDWKPLAAGEYHHVLTLDVNVPQDPWRGDDEPYVSNDADQGRPSATESWVARDGHGKRLSIEGLYGSDPDVYMTLSYNKRGYISGGGWTHAPSGDPLPIRERLRYADQVGVLSWEGPPSAPSHTHWYRQPEGYVSSQLPGWQGYVPTSAKGTIAEKFQTMAWGNTIAHFDRLNALQGDQLQTELLQLIAKGPVPGQSEYELGGDTYGASPEIIATEERIARAVRLLGAAPLAPHVRAAIFDWLSAQEPHSIQNNAEDVLGRRGIRVTFKTEHERVVPGHTWTIDEIVAAAKGKGQPVIGTLDAKPTYEVESYTEYRQWYVDVIFDEKTGRLLQEASHLKWGSDGAEPSLKWNADNTVTTVEMRPEQGVVGMGAAYLRVDRTTDFTPASSVCAEHPKVCR
jgi:hypothetical protein